jgi:hypothetical protein
MVLQSQTINQQVEMVQNWATPRAGATESSRPNNKGGIPLADQAKREQEKMWRTPSVAEEKNQNTSTQIYLQNQVGATPKNWATPQAHDAQGPKTPEQIEAMRAKGHGVKNLNEMVTAQVKCWITPQACHIHALSPEAAKRDMEKGNQITLRHQNPGKLNPRWVETLMGLPVGWVMPSCASPVTIEPTSCDSSATESSLPQPSELFAF